MGYFIPMLFGHLFGDYLLQPKWMALSKGESNFRCFIHCLVYTACVCLFMLDFRPIWMIIVFLTHFPIDRYSLADKWLRFIKGRTLLEFRHEGHLNIPEPKSDNYYFVDIDKKLNYRILRGSFHAVVYLVVDNTMHLALMYYIYKFI